MVEKLQQLGLAIELEAVTALVGDGGGALGRPHVARALVEAGVTEDIGEAFDRYLGRGRAAYVEKPLPTLPEVATLVHAVGGVAVAAHLGERGTEPQLRNFKEQGLDGLEVRHPSHDAAAEARLRRLADRLGLAITGGSDWHGDTELGSSHAELGGMQVPVEWLDNLERCRALA